MGIDRIGHGGPPVQIPETGGPSHTSPASPSAAGSAFQVPRASATGPAAAANVESLPPATALDRLRAGQIDLGGYVNLKVDEATAHLSALPPAQLESIRGALRDRLASDPSLVDLLQAATGETMPALDARDD